MGFRACGFGLAFKLVQGLPFWLWGVWGFGLCAIYTYTASGGTLYLQQHVHV